MKHLLSLVTIVICLPGCGRQMTVRAKIFERKEIENGRLLIKYSYVVNSKSYTDSSIIKNIVINQDSISLIIDPDNPLKGIPDLKMD